MAVLKIFADRPEFAIILAIIGFVGVAIQRLFTASVKFFGEHLKNIDDNFKSVAKDLGGLRVDVAKVAERLEAREEVVDTKFVDLDRRVTRLENKGERYDEASQ